MKLDSSSLRARAAWVLFASGILLSAAWAQTGSDASVPIRIWAQGQSAIAPGTWYTTYGTHAYSTYQGQVIFYSNSQGTYAATYVGYSNQPPLIGYLYHYTMSQPVSANLYVSGTFLDGTATQSLTGTAAGQTLTANLGTHGLVRVEAGKSYSLTVSALAINGGSLNVAVPPQYRVVLNGMERSRIGLVPVTLTVLPRYEGPPGAAGFASALAADRIEWRLPLGTLRNGDDAGSLRLVAPGNNVTWDSLFTPAELSCEPTSDEVYVHRENNRVRQVIANQVVVDVVVPAGATDRYEIRCYNPAQMQSTNLPSAFTGLPFVTYTVRRSDEAGDPATALKIVREFRNVTDATGTGFPVARTESTKLVRTGSWPNFTWTKSDWHAGTTVLQETVASIVGTFDVDNRLVGRSETLALQVPGVTPTVALRATRTYATLGFGEALTAEVLGTTQAKTAEFSYYENPAQAGTLGFVETVRLADGSWEAYDYYESGQSLGFLGGRVKYRYRPYGANATTAVSKNPALGEVTYYEYGPDVFGAPTRPTLVQTSIGGTLVLKRTIGYTYTSDENGDTVTTVQTDFGHGGVKLVTTTQGYSASHLDSFVRGKTTSVHNPNGVILDYVYERGEWNGTTFTVDGEGKSSRITSNDSQYINGKSVREVAIRDSRALLVRSESYAYSGGSWHLVGWTNYNYTFAGLLAGRTSHNGATYTAVWDGNLKSSETDETGIATSYTYDAGGRMLTATRAGASAGGATIAAVTTYFTYDASGKTVQERVGPAGGESLLSSFVYDDAGRLVSETKPGLGTTTLSYDILHRTQTVTRPDGSTVIETRNLDGSVASKTGTAIVAEYFTFGVEADGSRWSRTDIATRTSPRWTKTWTDMLGRSTVNQRPNVGGSGLLESTRIYDQSVFGNKGRLLKTTAPGVAPTLYVYNSLSQIIQTGLDFDGSGTLVPASNDRIAASDESYENVAGDWWLTKTESTYPTANSATAAQLAKTSRRLTGLGGTTSTGQLREDVRAWDVFGNETRRTTTVDIASKLVTVTTSRVGSSLVQVEKALCGLSIATQSFENLTTTRGYDALRRPISATDPRTGTTTTSYHANTGLSKEAVDPAGKRLSWKEYDTLGRVIFTKDALNHTVRTAYTLRGEVAQTWGTATYPVSYAYNEYGERVTMRTYRDPGDAATADSTAFPSVGQADDTTWEFDAASGLLRKKYDAKVRFVEYDYDGSGRLWRRYWARTLPSSATRVTATYAYDAVTGEQTGITYNDGTPALAYAFNRLGQNTSVLQDYIDDPLQTTLAYCLCGKVSAETFDSSFFGGRVLTHHFDTTTGLKGRTTGYSLALGATLEQGVTYGYETATGRIASVATQAGGGSTFNRTYSYSYLANSNLLSALAVDSGHPFTLTRTFEPNRDLLTSLEAKWSTASRTKYAYTYDDRRQRANVVQSGDVFADYGGPSAGVIHQNFAYNGRGELLQAATWLGDLAAGEPSSNFMSARKHEFAYDGIGNRRTSNTSGVAALRDHYVANELNQYVARENNTLPVGGTVADDAAIKVVAGSGALVAAGRHGRHWGDNMLLENLAGPYLGPVSFFAGKAGGGSASDVLKTVSRTAFLPPAWQSFAYDEDGNLLADGVWSYVWDAENRLISMQTLPAAIGAGMIATADARRLEFRYDHLGRRVQKVVRAGWNGSTYANLLTQKRFIYHGWNLVAEFTVNSGLELARTYTWGLDIVHSLAESGGVGALLQISDHSSGKSYLPSYDGKGNVAALFDAGAASSATACVAAYEYSPFGEFIRSEGAYAKENAFRFSTKFTDDETGLVYYGRRYYSPSQGRFLGRDPKGEPGGINLYAFTSNNPANRWDVLGMDSPVVMAPFVVKEKKLVYTEVPIPGTEGFEVVWEEEDDDESLNYNEKGEKCGQLYEDLASARATEARYAAYFEDGGQYANLSPLFNGIELAATSGAIDALGLIAALAAGHHERRIAMNNRSGAYGTTYYTNARPSTVTYIRHAGGVLAVGGSFMNGFSLGTALVEGDNENALLATGNVGVSITAAAWGGPPGIALAVGQLGVNAFVNGASAVYARQNYNQQVRAAAQARLTQNSAQKRIDDVSAQMTQLGCE